MIVEIIFRRWLPKIW